VATNDTSDNNRKWWTLVAVCAATFMLLLDITIVNVALPSIQKAINPSFADLQWVIDAYSLALATIVLNAGSLADRYGRKKLFMIGVVVFTAASAVCGAATSPTMLIISRAVQGLGGGIMFATSLSLLAQDFHGKERGVAFGIWGAITGAAVAVGPLAGGLLTNYFNWRWIFYVNLPIGIATVAIAYWKLRESKNSKETKTDWVGVVLLSGTLFTLIFGLIKANAWGWSSTGILSVFASSVILLVLFLGVEVYQKQPILQLSLFKKPSFTGAQLAAIGISSSIFALFLYITLYFQDVLGFSALQAGIRFLPVTLIAFVVSAIAGRLSSKVPGRYMIGIGLLLIGIGLLLGHGLTIASVWTQLLPCLMVAGFGIGMVNPSLANVAIGVVPPQESGMASGVNNTFRQIGIASGIAVLGAIFQASIKHSLSTGLAAAHFSASQLTQASAAISGGQTSLVVNNTPAAYRNSVALVAHQAFLRGFNEIDLIAAIIALAGAFLSFVLIRKKDLVVYQH
jgi:EmrB/QacA subfamily drug resistance transporter